MQTKTDISDERRLFTDVDMSTGEVLQKNRLERRVRNWLNYQDELIIHEVNTLPSLSVPDQSMTVKDILDRHTRGLGLGNYHTPVYNLDEEGNELMPVDWQRLDISERVERLEQAKAYTNSLRKKMADDQEKAPNARKQAQNAFEGQETVSAPTPEVVTTTDVSVK